MLSSVLDLGNRLRGTGNIKYHRYVKPAPQPDPENKKAVGNETEFFVVRANADGSFQFSEPVKTDSQYEIKKYFYLNYKTSDADSYKKYIFGDIYKLYEEQGKKINEDGNYRFADPDKTGFYALDSFNRGTGDAEKVESPFILNFRASFKSQIKKIEKFLDAHHNAFLHFDFEGKHWYELQVPMLALNQNIIGNFTREFFNESMGASGVILEKSLYKTLTTSAANVPDFYEENQYKNYLFNGTDGFLDLLYAVDYSQKAAIRKGDVKIVILPRGRNLNAEDIERFFNYQSIDSAREVSAESRGKKLRVAAAQSDEPDELFTQALWGISEQTQSAEDRLKFDFIFSKASSSASAPDIDMVELAGLERSLLERLNHRIVDIRRTVETDRPKSDKILPLNIIGSFLNILGDSTKAKKKYQSHLLKVLPQIYTGTYYHDDILLPALIEKTEFNTRNDKSNFGLLKFDFYFLTRIQNTKEDRLMAIQQSPSYRVGILLGQLARQFAGQNSPIKSFEKNYAGLLSRRIASIADVVRLTNDISQKLIMHGLLYNNVRDAQTELSELVSNFDGTYNKDQCALGFFESYFKRFEKKEDAATSGN